MSSNWSEIFSESGLFQQKVYSPVAPLLLKGAPSSQQQTAGADVQVRSRSAAGRPAAWFYHKLLSTFQPAEEEQTGPLPVSSCHFNPSSQPRLPPAPLFSLFAPLHPPTGSLLLCL